jgi:hypothetical protein
MFDVLAHEYGWTYMECLALPFPALLRYLSCIRDRYDPPKEVTVTTAHDLQVNAIQRRLNG